jgi:hypothetical protein
VGLIICESETNWHATSKKRQHMALCIVLVATNRFLPDVVLVAPIEQAEQKPHSGGKHKSCRWIDASHAVLALHMETVIREWGTMQPTVIRTLKLVIILQYLQLALCMLERL